VLDRTQAKLNQAHRESRLTPAIGPLSIGTEILPVPQCRQACADHTAKASVSVAARGAGHVPKGGSVVGAQGKQAGVGVLL
jgi:hypothetical protein